MDYCVLREEIGPQSHKIVEKDHRPVPEEVTGSILTQVSYIPILFRGSWSSCRTQCLYTRKGAPVAKVDFRQ